MATGLVIHIASGKDKHTEVLTGEHLRIGTCPDCDLRLLLSSIPQKAGNDGIVLELTRANGSYRVVGFDRSLDLQHNQKSLHDNSVIEDGDEVRIASSNLLLTFYPIRSLPAVVRPGAPEAHIAPFIEQAAIESAATARRDDAKVFLREFTRELVREINPSTKLITFAIALALVSGVLYIGFAMYKEMQRSRKTIDDQRAQLASMRDEVSKTNETINDLGRSNKEIRESLSLAVKLRSDYGRGVCLIAGSFYYVEAGTGRPLRAAEAQVNESGETVQTSDESTALTPEGKAAVAEFPFVGTGFYVGDGFVMTNRHIAQPWLADERAQSLVSSVRGQPRLRKLHAYFPDHPKPIPLKFKMSGGRDDVAVLTLDLKELPPNVPVLPLETEEDVVAVGTTVVMMGYPLGPDRLLALMDDAESRSIQQRYGTLDALLGYFAESRRIQPQTTQGNITDVNKGRIAYDARTAEGGSGAPVFGQLGHVIGINFAISTESQSSNFGVPIRYGIALLKRAGWSYVAPTENKPESAPSPPK